MSAPFVVIAVNTDDCEVGIVKIVDTFEQAKETALEVVKQLESVYDEDDEIMRQLEEYLQYGDSWVVKITQAE